MSKRFGRNQRRRAREAIAALSTEAALNLEESRRWYGAYTMADGLAKDLGAKLYALRAELDDAKDIAHRMSHLFPVTEFSQEDRPPPRRGEMFMVAVPSSLQELSQFLSEHSPAEMAYRRVPLALLLAKVHPDALNHGIHVRVHFANNEVAYGITAAAWHTMSVKERIVRIQREIAPQLAKLLVDTTDLRRYT